MLKTPAVWDPLFFFRRRVDRLMEAKFKAPQNNRGSMGYLSAVSMFQWKESIQRKSCELAFVLKASFKSTSSSFVRCWLGYASFGKIFQAYKDQTLEKFIGIKKSYFLKEFLFVRSI